MPAGKEKPEVLSKKIYAEILRVLQAAFFFLLENTLLLQETEDPDGPPRAAEMLRLLDRLPVWLGPDREVGSRYVADRLDLTGRQAGELSALAAWGAMLGDWLEEAMMTQDVREAASPPPDTRMLLHLLEDYGMQHPAEADGFWAGKLLSWLPMKMTKDKYSQYVRDGVRILNDIATKHPDEADPVPPAALKADYAPFLLRDRPSIAALPERETLERLFHTEFASLDVEQLMEAGESLEEAMLALHERQNGLELYLETLQDAQVILLFAESLEYLLDNQLAYRDLYYGFLEHAKAEDLPLFAEDLHNRLEEVFDELLDTKTAQALRKQWDGLSQPIDPDLAGLYQVYNGVSDLFYREAPEISPFQPPEGETDDWDAFYRFLTESLAELPLKLQKAVRRSFLAQLPCPYGRDGWLDAVAYGYESLDETGKQVFALRLVQEGVLQDEYEYALPPEHEHDHEHEHHHNHW